MKIEGANDIKLYCPDETKFMSNLNDKFNKLKKALAIMRIK